LLIGSFTIDKTGLNFKERIIQKIIVWQYYLLNLILLTLQKLLFTNKNLLQSNKILIFRTGSLGDSVCALPAFASIKKNFPSAHIDILTNAGAANLVSLDKIIEKNLFNEFINYSAFDIKQLFKLLREKRYDLIIQLPQDQATLWRQVRDIVFFRLTGIKKGLGWQIAATRFVAKHQSRLISFYNERERLLNILERNALKNFGLLYPLGITEEIEIKIMSMIKSKNIEIKENNIGMVVGAKRQQNRWPIEYFNEVAGYLQQKDFKILLFGVEEDFELTYRITGESVFNFCGLLSPLQTAGMMKYCKLVITNDTGPMHLSYAVGTPVIALFSGRDYPNKWYPPKDNLVLRSNTLMCVQCYTRCKFNYLCMNKINSDTVINCLDKQLNGN